MFNFIHRPPKPEPIHLPYKILCFDNYESEQSITFYKKFFLLYPFSDKEIKKYLNEYKTVIFKETDKFRSILLRERPVELKLQVFDKEGSVIREIKMIDTEYEELPNCEVNIRFKKFEDKYF